MAAIGVMAKVSVAGSIGVRGVLGALAATGRIRWDRAILPESRSVRAESSRRACAPDPAPPRRRRARRPVVLAARPRRPRGARVPRGRERVHRDALAHLTPLRGQLFDEIVGRVQETDASAPTRRGPFEYFSRTIEGQQYGVHCRRPSGGDALPDPLAAPGSPAGETVVLDENELARGHDYFAVGDLAVSPDQTVAVVQHRHQRRRALRAAVPHVRVADGDPGRELDDIVPDTYYGVAWANDNATVLYTRPDDAMRPWQVWRHTLGTAGRRRRARVPGGRRPLLRVCRAHAQRPLPRDLVGVEGDERGLARRRRRSHGRAASWSSRASRATSTTSSTTTGAGGDRAPRAHQRRRRRELRAHGDPGGVTRARPLAGGAPAPARRPPRRRRRVRRLRGRLGTGRAVERLRVLLLDADGAVADDHLLAMPDEVYSAWLGGNPEYETATLRYEYTSLVTPTSAYDYDPRARTSTLVKRQPVVGYDPDALREPSRSGRPRPTARGCRSRSCTAATSRGDGPSPMLLYGYGSYEVSIDPTFSVGAGEPARPRRRLRDRAHPRRRRARPALVRRRQAPAQDEHVHRLRRVRRAPRRRGLDQPRPPRGARRQRRRPAHGRGRQPPPRPVPRDRRRGAVRRLPHHDPRRDAAAHHHRVGGVGRPGRTTPTSTR